MDKTINDSTNVPPANVAFASLNENSVGISEYVTPSAGFESIIKQRISDFHVNEIGFSENVCKLNNFALPKIASNSCAEAIDPDQCRELITQKSYDGIVAIEGAISSCSDSVSIDVTNMDKSQRTQIHQMIKKWFKTIASSTYDTDGRKFIKFSKQANKTKSDRRSKWQWPHEYTYFLLHKENIDTMQAVSMLAPLINVKATAITYAGTKDKRGKTTQWMSVKRREPAQIVRAAQRARKMFVGNFMFREQPLKLGQLHGNRFRIALRQMNADEKHVNDIMESFKMRGFINYYGHQRFGISSSVPTHQIGLAIVQGNFKEACDLILKPRENDGFDMQAARQSWQANHNAVEALQLLRNFDRRGHSIEHKLLSGLVKHSSNDYLNALQMIPRNTRLMYIHAYQSLIWNEIASKRIATFGLKACIGDLVYVDDSSVNAEILDDEQDDEDENRTIEVNENSTQDEHKCSEYRSKVRPLTEADIQSNNFTIFDIVLPLPGHDITYPGNECSRWYEERLFNDNLSSEKLKVKQKMYSLAGAYRKLLVKPDEVNWYFMKYNHESDVLIRSDLEELRGIPEPKSIDDGQLNALVLEFNLPTSSYATMALREITKSDTSPSHQIHLQMASNKRMQDNADENAVPIKLPKLD